MKKVYIFILLFSIFSWFSAALVSSLFFSGNSLIASLFLPPILVGPFFIFSSLYLITLFLKNVIRYNTFDMISLDIFVINRSGKIIYLNKQIRDGFKDHNVPLPKDIENLAEVSIENPSHFKKMFVKVLQNPIAYLGHVEEFERLDGRTIQIKFIETFRRIIFVGIDKTENKILQKKEEDYTELIRSLPFPAGYKSADGLTFVSNTMLDSMLRIEGDRIEDIYKNTLEEEEKQINNLILDNKFFQFYSVPTFNNEGFVRNIAMFGIDKTSDVVNKKKLKDRIEYQSTLYKIQRQFINTTLESFNENVKLILKEVRTYLDCESVYFFKKESKIIIDSLEDKKSFTPSFLDKISKYKFEFPEDYIGKTINKVGNEYDIEKTLSSLGVKSISDFPISSDNINAHFGALNFTDSKSWKDYEISFLQIVSEILLSNLKRIETEKEFRESEETFKILTESSPMGVVIFLDNISRKDNIHYINKEAENILGHTKDDLNKLSIEDFIDSESMDIYQDLYKNKKRGIINLKNSKTIDCNFRKIELNEDMFSRHILMTMIKIENGY